MPIVNDDRPNGLAALDETCAHLPTYLENLCVTSAYSDADRAVMVTDWPSAAVDPR